MLLPPELLTLVFLTGLAAARAQIEDTLAAPTYTTAPDAPSLITTPPSSDVNDFAPAPTPAVSEAPPEDVYPCDLPDPPDWCNPPDLWHPEVSATGWDDWDEWNNDGIGEGGGQGTVPTATLLKPAEQTPVVITTRTPTIVDIRTSVEPSSPGTVDRDEATRVPQPGPVDDGHTEMQEPPAQHTAVQDAPQTGRSGEGSMPQPGPALPTPGRPAPAQLTAGPKSSATGRQTASSGNSLLDAIVNHLGNAQSGAQRTLALLPTAGASGEHVNHAAQTAPPTGTVSVGQNGPAEIRGAIMGPITPGAANTASAQDGITAGDPITLGSATLSLTPGLSTIVGTGTDTTLIAIQTDTASHTIITISSSGTAVTATITNAPATVTLPKTGFEASITGDAGRGVATSRPGVTAVTTSSKGVANERTATSGWTRTVVGILGALIAW